MGPFRARGVLPPDEVAHATLVIQAWPVVPAPEAHLERGLHLIASAVRRDPQNPLATLKTTSRAEYVYARLEARRAGADDALFLTVDDHLSEATSANIFLVRVGRGRHYRAGDAVARLRDPAGHDPLVAARTGPRGSGCGPFEGAPDRAPTWRARDEAFLSSSVAGILPVTEIRGRADRRWTAGAWTLRARADREAMIRGTGAAT